MTLEPQCVEMLLEECFNVFLNRCSYALYKYFKDVSQVMLRMSGDEPKTCKNN